jgi:L-fucose isomerase-like protein
MLGLCPIGKFVFSHEDALRYKAIVEGKLLEWKIDFTGIDDAVKDGMIRSQDDVEPAVRCLKARGVDALFLPHCNFGTEGAAAVIAREMGVPVLLWGPRDEAPLPDGTRLRDTLCGLFATSKVLRKLGVTFTYIENCRPEEPVFKDRVDTFVRAANVVKKMRRMRIGQLGQRIDFFWTTIINESELLERYGIEVLPIDLAEFIEEVKRLAASERGRYIEEIEASRSRVRFDGFASIDNIINIHAVRDSMIALARERKLDAIAVQSFNSLPASLGCMVEYSCAMVTDAGIPVACETDIHGAVSSVMLEAASLGEERIIFADLTIRHPENDNAVLIWHCGFPESLKKPGSEAAVGEHWILPGIPPGSCHWELKEGPLTVFRFDGDRGEYRAIVGEGVTIPGPKTLNTYVWMQANDWPAWERAFVEGPYIHHVACCYGSHSTALKEAGRYIAGLAFEQLP